MQEVGVRKQARSSPAGDDRGLRLVPSLGKALAVPRISTLGAFGVRHADTRGPSTEWQSKKSRDVLRLLVARRGRPINRERVIDILWPGAGSPDGDNRLAVALSRARTALDPEKLFPPDHFVRGLDDAIWLEIGALEVDVELFLSQAAEGLRLFREGFIDQAREALESAAPLYGGDFLEDQLYEEWTIPLREHARATFISAALAIGELTAAVGEYEESVGYFTRVLDKDPFAEEAHLGLVRSALIIGRHGEARRHYELYIRRMAELEIAPAGFPSDI